MRLWPSNNCCSFRTLGFIALLLLCVATWMDPHSMLLARFTRRVFHSTKSEGLDQGKPSSPVQVQRPLDVRDWSCDDVAAWMSSQGWVWRELDQYKARACDIGVTGRTLYDLEEDVLEHDFKIQFRLHRKVFLDAISKLQSAQPKGVHFPRNLWEYRKEHPIRASVYYSGLLAAPRLTMLSLAILEPSLLQRVHEAAVLRLRWHVDSFFHGTALKPSQGGNASSLVANSGDEQPDGEYSAKGEFRRMSEGRTTSDQHKTSWIVDAFNSSVLFWLQTLFAPGLQVALYMSLFYKRHPVALFYVGLVGLCRTAAEGHALLMLFIHPDMTAGEAFSSFICSHLMTPAMNAALAILQVALAPVLPGKLAWLLFWVRCVPLPLLTLWADFAAWVPSAADDGAGPLNGESRTRRHLNRNIVRVRRDTAATVHWPPPLVVPEELEDAEVEVPDVFKCPITLGIMTEPAQTPQGMTYERASIMKWVDAHKHDPCTKAPLRRRHLSPNLALRGVIENWLAAQCSTKGIPLAGNAAASATPVLVPEAPAPVEPRAAAADLPEASRPADMDWQLSAAALDADQTSGVRHRSGWQLRQRYSAQLPAGAAPSGLRLRSSEILLSETAAALPEVWAVSSAAGPPRHADQARGQAEADCSVPLRSASSQGLGADVGSESDDGQDRAQKRRLNQDQVPATGVYSFFARRRSSDLPPLIGVPAQTQPHEQAPRTLSPSAAALLSSNEPAS